MRYYFIVVEGGTEPSASESFNTAEDRDAEAQLAWEKCDVHRGDNIFKANVHQSGLLEVFPYVGEELESDEG